MLNKKSSSGNEDFNKFKPHEKEVNSRHSVHQFLPVSPSFSAFKSAIAPALHFFRAGFHNVMLEASELDPTPPRSSASMTDRDLPS